MNNLSSILDVSQVSFQDSLREKFLLAEIDFTVKKGDRLGIIGASGAGKSTLLRLLNRLIEPTSGQLYFNTQPFSSYPVTTLRQQIVLVPQEPKLLGMTVQDALSYPLKLQKLSSSEIKERLGEYCHLFAIPDEWLDRNELQLSVGQRQWVTLVRGLILKPSIVLLDEPTSALDMGLGIRLMEQLNRLSQEDQLTIIMVNHQLSWIRHFAGQVLVLKMGKIVHNISANKVNWPMIESYLMSQSQGEDGWNY